MTSAKRKRKGISIERLLGMLSAVAAVAGWTLLIIANLPSAENQPPAIQDGIRISRPVVSVEEMVPARVIVKDLNLPDDEINYHWEAYSGRIGEQLDRFQGPEVVYVAPDLPGTDVISVSVWDREGETDRDFYIITIVEAERLGSP